MQVASKLIPVQWEYHSVMDARMICFTDLLDSREQQSEQSKWKYVINLCGKELPLTINHEVVSHHVKLNGSSAIFPKIPKGKYEAYNRLREKIPFHLPYYKSMTSMGLSYDFVSFLLTNSTVIKVRQYFVLSDFPEEHFYAVLSAISGVPGGFNPNASRVIIDHYIWQHSEDGKHCSGKVVHGICIPKIDDLSRIMRETRKGDKTLFHNKFLWSIITLPWTTWR